MSLRIAVLGMHRSGTSCLTGLLEEAGVYLGPVSKQNPYNKKGNHERRDLMSLHQSILEANGMSWDRVNARKIVWSSSHLVELKRILAEYEGIPSWGFKDPRTLLLIKEWKSQVPDLKFIGTFRNPHSVAQSLKKRNDMRIEDAYRLWHAYNSRLLKLWKKNCFPVIDFDLVKEEYLLSVKNAFENLGIDISMDKLTFMDVSLRNEAVQDDVSYPRNVFKLYKKLKSIA